MGRLPIIVSVYLGLLVGSTAAAISRNGNAIVASSNGPEFTGTTFLLEDPIQQDGVVFAFAGYFRNQNPMRFQIWRPVNETGLAFELVGQWHVTPLVNMGREDIYIHLKQGYECLRVKTGDRLGIYIPENPGCVGYTFSTKDPSTVTYTETDPAVYPVPGETVAFNPLAFPYVLSAAAYVDTDLSKYPGSGSVGCPSSLVIPTEPDPGAVPGQGSGTGDGATGPQGFTGATGPRGAQGPLGPLGATGSSGPLGSVGSTGPSGPAGPVGAPGRQGGAGATGSSGPQGEQGVKGDQGETGGDGPRGPPGASPTEDGPTMARLIGDCTWCPNFISPYMVLGLLIWLIVLSLILLIFVIVYCCRSKPKEEGNYNRNIDRSELWKKYENGGYEVDAEKDDENMYSAIEEGGRVPEGRTEL